MGDCCSENSCHTQQQGSCDQDESRREEECTFAEDLLCLAKSAKHDLLKEKMKHHFEAKVGKKLDKIAEAAVDAVLAHLQQIMAQKHACEQYRQNLLAAIKD